MTRRDHNPVPRLSVLDSGYAASESPRRAVRRDAPIMPNTMRGDSLAAATMGTLATSETRFRNAYDPQGPGDVIDPIGWNPSEEFDLPSDHPLAQIVSPQRGPVDPLDELREAVRAQGERIRALEQLVAEKMDFRR